MYVVLSLHYIMSLGHTYYYIHTLVIHPVGTSMIQFTQILLQFSVFISQQILYNRVVDNYSRGPALQFEGMTCSEAW